jgi:hypothetical protein
MVKNLSENERLRQFLRRGAEEMWNCRLPIDSNLEKGGGFKVVCRAYQWSRFRSPAIISGYGKCVVKKSHIINLVPEYRPVQQYFLPQQGILEDRA